MLMAQFGKNCVAAPRGRTRERPYFKFLIIHLLTNFNQLKQIHCDEVQEMGEMNQFKKKYKNILSAS